MGPKWALKGRLLHSEGRKCLKNKDGGEKGPVALPVFKTGLAGITFAGRFDSFPPPPVAL